MNILHIHSSDVENYLKENEKELYDRLTEKSPVNSIDTIKKKYGEGEKIGLALLNVADFIENTGNQAAIALFRELDQELLKWPSDKPTLRRTWSAIETLTPTVATVSQIVWITELLK